MACILIAGGSLGGLMAANLLLRAGHQVQVFERAAQALDGRGAGIVTHTALIAGLRRCGMPAGTELGVEVAGRVLLDASGAVIDSLSMPQLLTSWSRLYQLLRQCLQDAQALAGASQVLHSGVEVHSVECLADTARLHTSAGVFEGDLVIAADGIRSALRQQLWPAAQPEYAGYVAWRGVCDEALLSRHCRDTLFENFGFCLPYGEQLIGYPVAGSGQRSSAGQRAWNFVWYRPAATAQVLAALLTDADGIHHPGGIAPHKIAWQQLAKMRADASELLAPQCAEIIHKTAQPFLQPIYDLASSDMAHGRVALLGDAAFVARPHVGMGVTKAMQDALALTDALALHGAVPAALRAYATARLPAAGQVVARGRRLGAYMQASGKAGAASAVRDARTVMCETAIDPESDWTHDAVPAQAHQQAGSRPAPIAA